MNHPIVLISVNVLAFVFVAAFAWWYGKRVSRSISLGTRAPAVSEGALGAVTLNPAAEGTGAHPGGEIRGEPPLAASYPRRGVPRPDREVQS